MKEYIKSVGALTVICGVLAVILAITNSITTSVIAENEAAAATEALRMVMPAGEGFEEIDISSYSLPEGITKIHKEANGGYVVEVVGKGYGAGLTIMCGIDGSGAITGAKCLRSGETLGYEKTFGDGMVGKTADTIESVDTVAGATLTTGGYKAAVKNAFDAVKIVKGEA